MMNLFSDDMRRNPYPMYDQMRSISPLTHFPPLDLWMILDYESVKWALNEPETLSSAATPTGGSGKPLPWMIFMDPPRHTQLRGLVSRAFTPRVIVNLEAGIQELSRELLNETIERGSMDLAADFAVPLPLMVIAQMIGIPRADHPQFKRWSDAILNLANAVTGGEEANRSMMEYRVVKVEMNDYLTELLKDRRAQPREDLLTKLVEAEVDGEHLSQEDILGFFQLLLLAGNETTTNLINNAIICLLEHPDQMARLQGNPELLPSAIEEVLRFRSPVQAAFRVPTRDIELHGKTIPMGKLVLLMLGAANRDPQQFPYPNHFDINREPNPHLAFGHGAHFCLGAALSRLEAKIALGDLLRRCRNLELASNEPWPPRQAFHVHGPTSLPIRFEPAGREDR